MKQVRCWWCKVVLIVVCGLLGGCSLAALFPVERGVRAWPFAKLISAHLSGDFFAEAAHSPLDSTLQTQFFRLIPDDADALADRHFAQAQQALRAANLPGAQREIEQALDFAEVWLTEKAGTENVTAQATWLRRAYQIYLDLLQRRQQQDPHGEFATLAWQANDHLHWLLANLSKKDELAAQPQLRVLTVGDVQRQLLDEQHMLLEYALGTEHSYVWLIGKDHFYSAELPAKEVIEAKATRIHALLSKQPEKLVTDPAEEFDQVAQELSDMLLGPVASYLQGQRLLVVTDGALQQVPFSVLPMPDSRTDAKPGKAGRQHLASAPLLAQYEITNLPSAATGLALRRQHQGQLAHFAEAGKSVAVIADPVFGKYDERLAMRQEQPEEATANANPLKAMLSQLRNLDLPTAFRREQNNQPLLSTRLPAARQEAEAITRLAPHSTKMLDFAANRATALSGELAQYSILHFATHGFSHPENPAWSGLLLSQVNERGESVNGKLLNQEIRQMHLPSELVVLSACETGWVEKTGSESYGSVAHSFLTAGAHRVIASLWKVNDTATAELMQRFYEQLFRHQAEHPAAALRRAQLEMWRAGQWKQPFYWAAFVLQGED